MNEGLKALERLIGNKVFISLGRIQGKKQFAIDINIIEKELKEYEQLKEMYNHALEIHSKLSESIVEYKKKDKALEIIKKKRVDYHIFKRYAKYGLEKYNDIVWKDEELTQEEFDSLKEMLL